MLLAKSTLASIAIARTVTVVVLHIAILFGSVMFLARVFYHRWRQQSPKGLFAEAKVHEIAYVSTFGRFALSHSYLSSASLRTWPFLSIVTPVDPSWI